MDPGQAKAPLTQPNNDRQRRPGWLRPQSPSRVGACSQACTDGMQCACNAPPPHHHRHQHHHLPTSRYPKGPSTAIRSACCTGDATAPARSSSSSSSSSRRGLKQELGSDMPRRHPHVPPVLKRPCPARVDNGIPIYIVYVYVRARPPRTNHSCMHTCACSQQARARTHASTHRAYARTWADGPLGSKRRPSAKCRALPARTSRPLTTPHTPPQGTYAQPESPAPQRPTKPAAAP